MIWLALRQFRVQALVAVILLAALSAYVLVTAPHIAHAYSAAPSGCTDNCGTDTALSNLTRLLPEMNDLVQLVPVIIGVFWGAPLVAREIESGSIRLVLMQSISRSRWLSMKLLVGAVGSALFAGLTSLMVTWWAGPWDRFNGLEFGTFDVRDIAPIGYGVFAFSLGAFVGLAIRRTIPAMVVTLVAFSAFVAGFGEWVRPTLPAADHFWTVQWTETSIYFALAIALGAASLWRARRHLT